MREGVARWYDLPFTRAEVVASPQKITLEALRPFTATNLPIVDSVQGVWAVRLQKELANYS